MSTKYTNEMLEKLLHFIPSDTLDFGHLNDPLFQRSLNVLIRNTSERMVIIKVTSTNRSKFKLENKEMYIAVSGRGVERLKVKVHQTLCKQRKRSTSYEEVYSTDEEEEVNEKTLKFLNMPRDMIHMQAVFGPQTELFGQVPDGFDEREHWTKQAKKTNFVYNKLIECVIQLPGSELPMIKGLKRQDSKI